MPEMHRCILTTKDFTLLEVMLERRMNRDDAFLRLLRRKLSAATVVFQDDLDCRVATINSRVDFAVDGTPAGHRILVHGGEQAYPGLSLPVTTLRGLALLGLTAGETIAVERSDSRTEAISLESVSYQPEAGRKDRLLRRRQAEPDGRSNQAYRVLAFPLRGKPAPVPLQHGPVDPDDDDPGPRAA